MSSEAKSGRVSIRPAEASDKGAALDFCRNTRPGGDYIPEVWDDWVRGPKGSLLVATLRGVPFGLGHYPCADDSRCSLGAGSDGPNG